MKKSFDKEMQTYYKIGVVLFLAIIAAGLFAKGLESEKKYQQAKENFDTQTINFFDENILKVKALRERNEARTEWCYIMDMGLSTSKCYALPPMGANSDATWDGSLAPQAYRKMWDEWDCVKLMEDE